MKNKNDLGESELNEGVIRVSTKPQISLLCGSKRIASYLYGLPVFSEELMKSINEGNIKLGGCCVTDDDPYWSCLECHTDFYPIAK